MGRGGSQLTFLASWVRYGCQIVAQRVTPSGTGENMSNRSGQKQRRKRVKLTGPQLSLSIISSAPTNKLDLWSALTPWASNNKEHTIAPQNKHRARPQMVMFKTTGRKRREGLPFRKKNGEEKSPRPRPQAYSSAAPRGRWPPSAAAPQTSSARPPARKPHRVSAAKHVSEGPKTRSF